MERELRDLTARALKEIERLTDRQALERVVTSYLGRNGSVTQILKQLPSLSSVDRRTVGRVANEMRSHITTAISAKRSALQVNAGSVDPTLPGIRPGRGQLHPITQFTRKVLNVMRSLGYDVHEGPELEDQWYNFEGLNIPADHPSRDIQDTFFIQSAPNLVLRTHASTVQLRALEHRQPPFRMVEVGRVYRHEATDASHESMFTQIDAVAVDRDLTMAHLVTTLKTFFRLLYGSQVKIRIRPSYFPFVEPGIEVDMQWSSNGKTKWLELLGAGMVHPHVIRAMKLNPKDWKGFAFGMGLDRLVLLERGIPDIRLFYRGQREFLKQF